MNTKNLIAAVAALTVAGAAFAGSNDPYVDHSDFKSTKTRAEVRAELERDYALGLVGTTPEFVDYVHVASTRSRDDVRKEAAQAARSSQLEQVYFGG